MILLNKIFQYLGRNQIYLILILTVGKALLFWLLNLNIKYWEDDVIAKNLLNEGVFYYYNDGTINHSFTFPVYPFILYLFYSLFGNHVTSILLLHSILVFTTSLCFLGWIRALLDRFKRQKSYFLISWAGLLIIQLHPAIINYSYLNAHPFVLYLCLFTASLYLIEKWSGDKTRRNLIWVIAVVGILILQRSSLGFVIVILIVLNWSYSKVKLALICIMVLLPSLCWSARNYLVDGVFGLTSTSGKLIWKGSIKDSDGSNYISGQINYYEALSHSQIELLDGANTKEQNDLFWQWYRGRLNENPSEVFGLFVLKLKNFWLWREGIGTEYSKTVNSFIPIYLGVYLLFLIFFLIAVAYDKRLLPYFLMLLGISIIHAVFYVEMRHRILFEPMIYIIASIFALDFRSTYLRKKIDPER